MESEGDEGGSLDFLSPTFHPLLALQTSGLEPPNPRVRPLDNLNKCRAILPKEVPESLANRPVRAPRSAESVAAQERAKARSSLQVEKAAERGRQHKILDLIAEKLQQGPLSLLADCYWRRGRVQVWTRHTRGPRGVLTGFLYAADKHMNLLLRDVDEQYTVRRRVPRLVRARGSKKCEGQQAEVVEGEAPGDAMELRFFPKLEHRRRHLQQVFLRGDSIILVRKVD